MFKYNLLRYNKVVDFPSFDGPVILNLFKSSLSISFSNLSFQSFLCFDS